MNRRRSWLLNALLAIFLLGVPRFGDRSEGCEGRDTPYERSQKPRGNAITLRQREADQPNTGRSLHSRSRRFFGFRQGRNLYFFNVYLRFDWKSPEEYDFSKIDAKMDEYLKLKPDALFIPRILLTPDDWWCTTFPEDITMRDDGSPAGMFGNRCHPTLASSHYRELSHKAMQAFLDHVEGKYGGNILGYQVGNGFGGEWLMFNSFWETRPVQSPPLIDVYTVSHHGWYQSSSLPLPERYRSPCGDYATTALKKVNALGLGHYREVAPPAGSLAVALFR